jgi:hypothetical protein
MMLASAHYDWLPARRGYSFCLPDGVVVIDEFLFFPTRSPPPLSRPAGRKKGASFGRVCEVSQYTCHCALRPIDQIISFPTCFSSGYFFALNTRPNMAVSSLWLLGSDTNFATAQSAVPCGSAEGWANLGSDPKNQRAGGESGAKKEKNANSTITLEPFAGQEYTYMDCHVAALAMTKVARALAAIQSKTLPLENPD